MEGRKVAMRRIKRFFWSIFGGLSMLAHLLTQYSTIINDMQNDDPIMKKGMAVVVTKIEK